MVRLKVWFALWLLIFAKADKFGLHVSNAPAPPTRTPTVPRSNSETWGESLCRRPLSRAGWWPMWPCTKGTRARTQSLLLTTRTLTSEGLGAKNRDWNAKDLLVTWRTQWEITCNEALEEAGKTVQIDMPGR